MAKTSSIFKNQHRRDMNRRYEARRSKLKAIVMDKNAQPEERFNASLKLAEVPRNSARCRIRNRCEITGRPRGFYRKFNMSRIALREFASNGLIPGVTKASW